jgi:tetratricopeptide (TPR) repeat protein
MKPSAPALLLVLAALVYLNILPNDFVQDDFYYIVNNRQIQEAPWRLLVEEHENSRVYRPVAMLSFALEYQLAGLRPWVFHFDNLLLHALVSALLFVVLRDLLARPRLAFAAAALFAVHPIHTEAVAQAVGRTELLAALFLLLAWRAHLQDRWWIAAPCALAAMLAKESAIGFLALAAIADYAVGRELRPRWPAYAAYTAVSAIFLVALAQSQGFQRELIPKIDNPLAALPAGWRIVNALRVAAKYVALQCWPATLSSDYSYNVIPVTAEWSDALPALLAALAVAGAWLWSVWRRGAAPAVSGAIYLTGFAAAANVIVPIGTMMGERLAYWPSAGFCLLAALLWDKLAARQATAAWAVLAVACAALGARTVMRNRDWRNEFTLFQSAVAAAPASAKAQHNLGVQYSNRGDFARAVELFQAALRIEPEYADARAALGFATYRTGRKEEGLAWMEQAFRSSGPDNPHYALIAVNYAAALVESSRHAEALPILSYAITVSPRYSRAYSNRAVIQLAAGRRDAARADAEAALRLDEGNTQARGVLARLAGPLR